ncbi:MAG: polysaccharide pyruvyl transferase family protein [Bacteroidaceae bacterium]|nr:polysaccharide pyruvyl transferase family protein [Bacteroidaceae bacterium]
MKKKIAIITWLGQGNYGTTLQAYALKEFIENIGYETIFPYTFNVTILYRIKRIIMQWFAILFKSSKKVNAKHTNEKKGLKYQKLNKHLQTYNTTRIKNRKEYKLLLNNTYAFVSGSDQIWNTYHSYDPFYFLNFAKDKKRVAYASSIGTNSIPDKYQRKIKNHLMKFQSIGVREESAVKILSELTGRKDIIQVADPTLLLTSDDWKKLTEKAEIEILIPEKYILCYLIGNNEHYIRQLDAVRIKYEIETVIVIPAEEHSDLLFPSNVQIYRDAGPVEFVHLIQHATVVCTDSFHATVLSINFNINFVEFVRFAINDDKSQNSRINDLLSHYHLENRIYNENSEEWSKSINYLPVNEFLEEDRQKALNYLTKALED